MGPWGEGGGRWQGETGYRHVWDDLLLEITLGRLLLGTTDKRPPYKLRRRLLKHSPVPSPSPLMTSFTPVSAPSLAAPPNGPNGEPPVFPKKRKRGATRLSCAECRRWASLRPGSGVYTILLPLTRLFLPSI